MYSSSLYLKLVNENSEKNMFELIYDHLKLFLHHINIQIFTLVQVKLWQVGFEFRLKGFEN